MRLSAPFIKICSLRARHQAEFARAAGADAVGLIFADARRRVSITDAGEIVGELRRLDGDRPTLAVGVFVDQSPDEVNRTADIVGLDAVQLHGSEPPEDVARIERPVMKIVVNGHAHPDIGAYASLATPPVAYLVDGHATGARGGTGERADWEIARVMARAVPLILAGGLTPANVSEAIRTVRPRGVDVSSGVETDGVKDRAKVIAFVMNARAAFASLDVGEGGVVPVAEAAEPVHRAQTGPRGGDHAVDDRVG